MNNEKRISFSTDNSFSKNPQEFKFRRQNDKALTHINTGKEIWYFKNEILKDIKNLEKTLTDKFNSTDFDRKEEIKALNEDVSSLNVKLKELSTKITEDNSIKEKINNFDSIKAKILDSILINDVKVNNLDREIRESISDMKSILKETVIYTGVIGPSCKFKTFHDLLDFFINEIKILSTSREKNMLDLTSFKKRIETNVQGFKIQLESFGRSSTKFTTDNFNKIDKDMNELFHKCNDKIDDIKSKFDEKLRKLDDKIDEIKTKLVKEINEIKDKIESLEKSNNNNIKLYQNLKDDINKLNENVVKRPKRNSIMNNLNSIDTNNTNNNINKNKIIKKRSILRNDKIEELKNNNTNSTTNINKEAKDININNNRNDNSDNTNNNTNKNENNLPKIDSEDDMNESDKINSIYNKRKNQENIKILKDNSDLINLKKDLKIDVESLNTFNLNKYLMNKTMKKKNEMENNSDYNKRRLLLSDIGLEDIKQKSFSPKRKSIKIKNMKNNFNASNHSDETDNSKLSIKTIVNAKNIEMIKSLNILNESQNKKEKEKKNLILNLKTPTTDKNKFNKNIKIFKEQNKHWFNDKGKRNIKRRKSINAINSLNIENNNDKNILNERYNLIYQRTAKSSTKFKNIMLTLEGTKKMIYETKDFHKGKNLYHIESLSDTNKKKSYLRERLESCKPYLINKLYKNHMCSYFLAGKEEAYDFIKYKNHRLMLNKSASSKIYLKNKHSADYENKGNNINTNLAPSLQVTKYAPPKKYLFAPPKILFWAIIKYFS